ncbi:hypothetical protein GCM10027020_18270 [Nocardioides salsibiostraticola]
MVTDTGLRRGEHGVTRPTVPPEELRFGVILNGGVSLAVWMGGAVGELDRLVKAKHLTDSTYTRVLDIAGCVARADVISGTSAGGINGAALALSQVNSLARIASLRDIWVDKGQIETLLRKPFRGQPTSLLQGDEYFLPALNDALLKLAHPAAGVSAEEAPIDLTITATVLRGNQTIGVDSMGQQLPQKVHAARFHWSRHDPAADPFEAAALTETSRRLALAARCTASFPVAFEPVFVPVGQDASARAESRTPEDLRLRPDMDGLVEEWGDEMPARDRSRYVVDGGVLANTPTLSALEAVESMEAKGAVRRVMLMVYPHAEAPDADDPDEAGKPPTLAGSLSGLLGALTAQGGRTYVEEFERHNRAAAGRRGTRHDVLDSIAQEQGPTSQDPAYVAVKLNALARELLPHYRRLRMWRAGRDLAARVLSLLSADQNTSALAGDFSFERVRQAAENAQRNWADRADGADGPDGQKVARPRVSYVPDDLSGAGSSPTWGWGVLGALGVAEAASDLARRVIWLLEAGPQYDRAQAARETITHTTSSLQEARRLIDMIWETPDTVARGLVPTEAYWTLRIAWFERCMLGVDDETGLRSCIDEVAQIEGARRHRRDGNEAAGRVRYDEVAGALITAMLPPDDVDNDGLSTVPGAAGVSVRELVMHLIGALRELDLIVADLLSGAGGRKGLESAVRGLKAWHALLSSTEGGRVEDEELLQRLLNLEVATTSLGDEVTTGATLPVEVVQLSAQTENGFTEATRTSDDKLAGMSVSRFGGFLKRSWRVNDWIWGRMDSASVLCATVLQPSRLRRAAAIRGELVDPASSRDAAEVAVTRLVGPPELWAVLLEDPRAAAAHKQAVQEMTAVLDEATPDSRLPPSMPNLARLCAWALHLDIIGEELPELARTVTADVVDGASPRANACVFVQQYAEMIKQLDGPPCADLAERYRLRMQALRAFDRAGIGRENLEAEATSDQMIRTMTSAAAVATTVLDSDSNGMPVAKPLTRTLRGGMLLPYWVISALTSRSMAARSLALLGIALGGVLLALSLLGVLPQALAGPGAALGSSTLLMVLAYGALRTGTMLHGLVLLTPVAALATFAVEGGANSSETEGALYGGVTLLVVIGLVVALMALGSLQSSSRSVWTSLDALAVREGFTIPIPPKELPPPTTMRERVDLAKRGLPHAGRLGGIRVLAVLKSARQLIIPALLLGVVAVVVVWTVNDPWPGVLEFVRDHQVLFAFGAVAAVLLGAYTASRVGRLLQVLRADGDSAVVEWTFSPVTTPAGTAVGWSVMYGAGYLVAAGVLVAHESWTREAWVLAILLTTTVLGIVLTLVLPWWLPLRAIRITETKVRHRIQLIPVHGDGGIPQQPVPPRELMVAQDLLHHGIAYRWLVSKPREGAYQPTLTRRGKRLARSDQAIGS